MVRLILLTEGFLCPEPGPLSSRMEILNGRADMADFSVSQGELRSLLRKHQIEWDEHYAWD